MRQKTDSEKQSSEEETTPAAASSCEIQAPGLALLASARAAFDPDSFRWSGTADEPYKSEDATNGAAPSWRSIKRVTLLGPRQPGMHFHLRYFEIAPGGHSSREKHVHEHVVIGFRGEGIIEFDGRQEPVRYGDIVYVAPESVHQLRCAEDATEPFGFLCLVNSDRDRPVLCPPGGDASNSEGASR